MSVRSVVCPVHVGREEELTAVRRSLEAAARSGRTLLIGGEAGLGKSRMAAEAAAMAGAAGFTVLSGACPEGESSAYVAVTAALRRHLRDLDAAAAAELFEGPARLAATLVPELAAGLGLLDGAVSATPEDVLAAVWHLIRALGREGPVMLLIEDIHWADPDSLRLVARLAAEAPTLPLWLVATYRTDDLHRRHPLTAALTRLRRVPAVDELRLLALDREGLRAMVSALFGGTSVGDEFADALRARTEGNPFFVEELCAVLVERGDIYRSGGDWSRRELGAIELPETVRDTLLSRVERLPDDVVELLRVAAVVGDRVDPAVLAHAAGADADAVEAAVVCGLEHMILVEPEGAVAGQVAFRHALTREALADDLVGPERRRVHRKVAQALLETRADDVDGIAAEVSEHFELAGDAEAAAEHALRAARQAVQQHALAVASRHYERALRLGAGRDAGVRLDVLLEAAEATWADTDPRPAVAFAREARQLARERGDPAGEAKAMRRLWMERWRTGDSQACVAMVREAYGLVAGRGDGLEMQILGSMLRYLAMVGQCADEARELLPGAIAKAEATGDLASLSVMHNTRGMLARSEEENVEAFEMAARYGHESGAHDCELVALVNAGYTWVWLGRLAQAVVALTQGVTIAERHLPARVAYGIAGLAWARALSGDPDGAVEAAEPYASSSDVPARMVALTALTDVALQRGDHDTARALAAENLELAEASHEGQRIDPARAHSARAAIGADPGAAEAWAERIITQEWTPWTHALVSPDLARGLAARGAISGLTGLVKRLEEITAHDDTRHNRAALTYCRGVLSAARGDLEAARSLLTEAAAEYRRMPCPFREAETLCSLAEVELDAGRTTEAGAAASAAQAIARRIGSPPVGRAAAALLERTHADVILATVLITDVVGSTELATRLGDRAWRELLERHHAVVRRELRSHRGREVDTTGDGFLATFDSPARAIRCARAIADALRDLGIEIRAGLHTGECEVIDGRLAGIAVHTAARVAALAGPDEVLVSSTVRDLVAGSGLSFHDRGVHPLRGLPGEWRLFALDAATTATAGRQTV